MPSLQATDLLQDLQPDSNKRLPDSVITGMTLSLTRARYQLIRSRKNPSGAGFICEPTLGASSISMNSQAIRKLMTLSADSEQSFTGTLNTALLGGASYPILEAVLGTFVGTVSAGAGLLFTVASTALNIARTTQRVLAREGDEIWQVEEIGRAKKTGWASGDSVVAVHVGSYFLVDPYRSSGNARHKGWLIHEERTELTLVQSRKE